MTQVCKAYCLTLTVTYIIENYEDREQLSFEGAPKFNFDLVVRINLDNEDQASEFLNRMMEHSYCTYRISRTSKKNSFITDSI